VPRSLPVADFKPRKDQRKAVNAWNRFVLGDAYPKELAILHPKTKQEKAEQRNFDLVRAVHEAEAGHARRPPEPAHRFEVTLDRDDFTEEKYAVYLEYQMAIHHETAAKNSRQQFRRFLCHSPLEQRDRTVAGKTQRLGSFHQCYRLDGRLVAFAVLDLLPHCVSGVYFVYHPDFSRFCMGKVSALREAALAREGGYGYYYMGYYIHSCPKMQYKNDYAPQEFLDLDGMGWLPLDAEARRLMDENHFVTGEVVRRAREDGEGYERAAMSEMTPAEMEAMHPDVRLSGLEFAGMMSEEEVRKIDLAKVKLQIGDYDDMVLACSVRLLSSALGDDLIFAPGRY
jgi:arginine-tRNA-protein transferase